jgi:hypothetical protein
VPQAVAPFLQRIGGPRIVLLSATLAFPAFPWRMRLRPALMLGVLTRYHVVLARAEVQLGAPARTVQADVMETSSEPAWLSAALALGPHVVWAAFLVFVVIYLREPIGELLKRLKGASTPIGSVEIEPSQQRTQPEMEAAGAAAREAEARVEAEPAALPRWLAGTTPTGQVIQFLRPYLVGERPRNEDVDLLIYWFFSWLFEAAYRTIHGTQVSLLQTLDARQQITRADAQTFYQTSQRLGNRLQTFDQYMGYITRLGLAAEAADAAGYTRMPLGHQFLVYLATESLPMGKPW